VCRVENPQALPYQVRILTATSAVIGASTCTSHVCWGGGSAVIENRVVEGPADISRV
jgi:hypothetical protein